MLADRKGRGEVPMPHDAPRNLMHLTRITQPLARQWSTSFRTRLNTNEHDLFTHPRYDAFRSLASLGPFTDSSATGLSKPSSKKNTKKHTASLKQKEHNLPAHAPENSVCQRNRPPWLAQIERLDFNARRFKFEKIGN